MTALPLVAALAWIVALIADPGPLGPVGALLTGVGLMLVGAISVVGMTVTGGRWAHRLALASVLAGLTLAALRPLDGFWIVATAASVGSAAALFLPSVTGRIRRRPAADGPPEAAVLLTTGLLLVPFLLGVVAGRSATWIEVIIGLSAPISAFLYARVIAGGLIGVRVAWPALALGLSPLLSLQSAVLTWILTASLGILAWRADVKTSFHPPRETGSTYPIPPELAPPDILDAAHLDDRGRPR